MVIVKENLSKKCGIYKIENVVNGRFYIGSSINLGNRRNSHFGQLRRNEHNNQHLQYAFNKYGESNFKFEVIEFIDRTKFNNKNDLKYYVLDREQFWIDSTGCTDKSIGYNIMTKAVIGAVGFKPSKDTRKKLSEANKGKACPEHVKKQLSEDRKGKPVHENTIKAKLEAKRKPVVNLRTGIEYISVKQAEKCTKFNQGTIIRSCKGIGGWSVDCYFAYIGKNGEYEIPEIKPKIIKNKPVNFGKKIINLNTKEVFNGISEASEASNISKSAISKCCAGKTSQSGGFDWAYLDNNGNPIIKTFEITKGRKVINLDTGIKFNSCAEASRFYGNIQKSKIGECCAGRRKTCGGYKWASLDENDNPIEVEYKYKPYKRRKLKPQDKRIDTKKKVINIDTNVIYESVSEAGRAYNAKSTTRISDCCKGKANTAFGYRWKYYEES